VGVVYTHPSQAAHGVDGHPERPARVDAFLAGLGDAVTQVEAPAATVADLERVHVPGYAERIFAAAAQEGVLDADAYVVRGSAEAAALAAGAAIAAAVDDALGRPGAVTRLPITPRALHRAFTL